MDTELTVSKYYVTYHVRASYIRMVVLQRSFMRNNTIISYVLFFKIEEKLWSTQSHVGNDTSAECS